MKLYYMPGACSLSPHIALREAGLNFELKKVDGKTKQIDGGGDFMQINSKGYVPTLQLDNGQVLTEGPAVVQYIADLKPESGLAPKAGTAERYQLQEWLSFITSELHKAFSPLFNQSAAPEWKKGTTENLTKRLNWLDKELTGKTYLMGEHFTVADAYLFTVLSWTSHVGIDLNKWPALAAFVARVGARPKVQEALAAEGLLKKAA